MSWERVRGSVLPLRMSTHQAGMAEPGTGAECGLVPNECQEYSGAGLERGRALSRRFRRECL